MNLLESYDKWLHRRVMNPLFKWIQTWLHWNRFDLICFFAKAHIVSVVFVILARIFLFLTSKSSLTGAMIIVDVMFFAMILAVYLYPYSMFPALKKASERFEEGLGYAADPILIVKAAVFQAVRRIFSAVFSFSIAFWLFLAFVVPLRTEETTTHFLDLISLTIYLLHVHLWDSDDVKPEDRISLLESKRQEVGNQ
ncbi:MAG: hypothetical protein ABIH21_05460 [Patescibacteria group bacterium]